MAIIERDIKPTLAPVAPKQKPEAVPQTDTIGKNILALLDRQRAMSIEQQAAANENFIAAVQELTTIKKRIVVSNIVRNSKGFIEHLEMTVEPFTT